MLERCRPLHAFDLGRLAGPRHRRAARDRRRADGDARRRHAHVHGRGPPDLRRRAAAAGHRRDLRWRRGRGRRRHDRDPARVRVLRAGRGSPAPRSGSDCAPRRARGSNGVSIRTAPLRARCAAMELFAEVAAAVPAPGAIDFYPLPIEPAPHHGAHRARATGCSAPSAPRRRSRDLLVPLGIETEGTGDDFTAIAPTFRPDLEREIDIVEEVGRRVGLAEHPAHGAVEPREDRRARRASSRSAGAWPTCSSAPGYDEAYTLPLLAPADVTRAGFATDAVIEVENPLRAEESLLRPRLLPGLLRAVAFNAAHGTPDVVAVRTRLRVRAAEGRRDPAGRTHAPRRGARRTGAARAARTGSRPSHRTTPSPWSRRSPRSCGSPTGELEAAAAPGFHPVRTAAVVVDGVRAGCRRRDRARGRRRARPARAGRRLRARRRGAPGRNARAAHLRRGLAVPGVRRSTSRSSSTTPCPPATCSPRSATTAGDLAERVELFDVFRSDAIGDGRVSLAFTVSFRSPDRTLTDDEVAERRQR